MKRPNAGLSLLLTLTVLVWLPSSVCAQDAKKMTPEQSQRLASDLRPSLVAFLGDEAAVSPLLLQSVVETLAVYKAERNLILYSPIHGITFLMHIDAKGKLFVYALGFRDLYDLFGYKFDPATSYMLLRYDYVPVLIARLKTAIEQDANFVRDKVHPALQRPRRIEENQDAVLFPFLRITEPANAKCLETLDRGALAATIVRELPDQRDTAWFEGMFAADIVPGDKGGRSIIFVNDLTRRLHMFVPVTMQRDRCVPGSPTVTYIR